MKSSDVSHKISCDRIVIIDTSGIEDEADYGGMLYELKKLDIRDGKSYQVDNAGDLLMHKSAYIKCSEVLKHFKARSLNWKKL